MTSDKNDFGEALKTFVVHWSGCIDVSNAWALVCRDLQGGGTLGAAARDEMERALKKTRWPCENPMRFLDTIHKALTRLAQPPPVDVEVLKKAYSAYSLEDDYVDGYNTAIDHLSTHYHLTAKEKP